MKKPQTLAWLLAWTLIACSNAEPTVKAGQAETASDARPMPVRVMILGEAKLENMQGRYTGIVQAAREVAVGVNVGGQVQQVLVREGDFVEQGAAIMQLDQRRLLAGKESIQAQVMGAQAQLDELIAGPRKETIAVSRASIIALQEELRLAEMRLVRRRGLLESNSISQEELDVSHAQVLTLKARLLGAEAGLQELVNGTRPEILAAQRATLAAMQANLRSIEIDLTDSMVTAPFAGRIQSVLVHEGAVVPAGSGVVLLVETGALEARFGLSAKDLQALDGDTLTVEVRGQTLPVLDKRLLPNLDPTHRTLPWILDLDISNMAPAIHPGQVATLQWSRPLGQTGWRIPLSALTEGVRGMWTGFVVVEKDGAFHVQPVDLQVLHTLPDAAVVRGALKKGDHLLMQGVDRIVAGQRVQIVQDTGDMPRE
ncbi:MAG: multidrug efflux pump subunit AcrA (membrane-fusion protein) [Planctomycetota bacterium]|jgi:multidrug efflux pump subunit AcrA (membrane-fusion protein)